MLKQIIFLIALLLTLSFFSYTVLRLWSFFKLTKPFPIRDFSKRFGLMVEVAFGQTRILRKPGIGLMHALVFWGFCVILVGSIEMLIDGLFGTERCLSVLGGLYSIITGSGDIFAFLIFVFILMFIGRRAFLNVKRFSGIEMKHKNHRDAYVALSIILFLMVSLLGMNVFYLLATPGEEIKGWYPVSMIIAKVFSGIAFAYPLYQINWWFHILLIFLFANILPYSKHFHVFLSVPNVFLSRLQPLGYLPNMDNITQEVKMMLNPETAYSAQPEGENIPSRFGVKDVEDVTWKNYFDALTCTQCGRCTSVCPANLTGKKLSPRKIMMDLRTRMNEIGPSKVKNGSAFSDQRSLIRDYISVEEIWACTTCNACSRECPVNINHPSLIVDLRRYLVMEEAAAPAGLNAMFTNIENNGAPWQFSPEDRLLWTKDLI